MSLKQENPGVVVLDKITDVEMILIQNLTGLPYKKGDIIYFDGKNINVLPIGRKGQVLTVDDNDGLIWK